MQLYDGRPADGSGRTAREVRTYDLLDSLGISYQRTDHPETPSRSMELCKEVDGVLGVLICKNLFLCNRQKSAFYLLLMPGDKPFKTRELSAQLGVSRLSFGSAEDMERLLGVSPGSVSVLGLMNDSAGCVRLLVDAEVLEEEFFGCHPCVNTSSLKLRIADLLEKFLPAVGHEMTVVQLEGETE